MKIALDFDDVCVDAESYKWQIFSQHTTNTSFETVSKASMVESGLLTYEQYEQIKLQLYTDIEGSLEHLKFREGAVEGISKLVSLGHTVEIVTARLGPALEVTKMILETASLQDTPVTGVGYGNSKNSSLSGFDIFIDDDPGHLVRAIGIVGRLFMMTTKENKDFEHEAITRVNNWAEFLEAVASIES